MVNYTLVHCFLICRSRPKEDTPKSQRMEKSVEEKQHKRRVRYSGKYPKKFEEKYKEHNPEKYKDVVEHVIAKGSTPAGMHISIMVKEILDFLQSLHIIYLLIFRLLNYTLVLYFENLYR